MDVTYSMEPSMHKIIPARLVYKLTVPSATINPDILYADQKTNQLCPLEAHIRKFAKILPPQNF